MRVACEWKVKMKELREIRDVFLERCVGVKLCVKCALCVTVTVTSHFLQKNMNIFSLDLSK